MASQAAFASVDKLVYAASDFHASVQPQGQPCAPRFESFCGILGASLSFAASSMAVMAWLYGAGAIAPLALFAILGLPALICRRLCHSWAFAIGAFWGSSIPLMLLIAGLLNSTVPPSLRSSHAKPIFKLMGLPILNYTNAPDPAAARREAKRQDDLWWLLGLILSFLGCIAVGVAINVTAASSRWPRTGSLLELLSFASLLVIAARSYHKRYSSWSFASGAIIGAILPVGVGLFFLFRLLF